MYFAMTQACRRAEVFERKRPTLLDNPMRMRSIRCTSSLNFFVALGFLPDLAAVLQKSSKQTRPGTPPYPVQRRAGVDLTA